MSNMFENYENLSNTYVPNNQRKVFEEQEIFDQSTPKKEYDINGNFIGYSFSYGDTLQIPYSINKTIQVEGDAIIYNEYGQSPSTSTPGVQGQKAYNIADIKCWVCESLDSSIYIWKQLNNFTYPKNGTKKVTIKSDHFYNNNSIEFIIYDFRWEKIYSKTYSSSENFSINIDNELSKKLLPGLYNCSVSFSSDNYSYIDGTFVLIVKNSVQNNFLAIKEDSYIEEVISDDEFVDSK